VVVVVANLRDLSQILKLKCVLKVMY